MAIGHLEILWGGVRYTNEGMKKRAMKIEKPIGATIKDFSEASRRRLRYAMMRHWSESPAWRVTLTLPGAVYDGQADWRRRWSVFRKRCVRSSTPFIWRLELHRSAVPHIHAIAFGGQGQIEDMRSDWLDVWGLQGNLAALDHAVQIDPVEDRAAWLGYCALHNQKTKIEQEPWRGRVWGVVCKHLLLDGRDIYFFRSKDAEQRFRRLCDRRFRHQGRKKRLPPDSSWDSLGMLEKDWIIETLKKIEKKS